MPTTPRQKILLLFIVIACIYIVWQLYDIFSGPKLSDVATKQIQKNEHTAPIAVATPKSAATPESVANQKNPEDQEADLVQARYAKLLDQYQLLKMKHMLLEEEVAIATAKQKIASLGADTDSGESLDNASVLDSDNNNQSSTAAGPLDDDGYSVVYIDYQGGHWNATINYQGHFAEVTIGSRLADGGKVVDIDRKSVVIKRGAQFLKLVFGGSVPIKNDDSAVPAPASATAPVAAPAPVPVPAAAAPILKPKEAVVYTQLVQHQEIKKETKKEVKKESKKTFYCLQLRDDVSKKKIDDFVATNKISDQVIYLHGANKDETILVYGKYASIADARAALEKLSPAIKQLNPWIRPMPNLAR